MNRSKILKFAADAEQRLDLRLFAVKRDPVSGLYYNENGEEVSKKDMVIAGTAAAGVGAGGAVAARGALRRRYGANMMTDPAKARTAVARGVQRDIAGAGAIVGAKAKVAARAGLTPVVDAGEELSKRLGRASAVGAAGAAKGRGVRRTAGLMGKALLRRFDARGAAIELAARCEG